MEKIKVLVVDDEAAFGRLIKINLEATGEFAVTSITQGILGLSTAEQIKPDIIFLDIMMPDKSGDEVYGELKEQEATKNIPVVFLTAMATKEDEESSGGMIAGRPILAKPVSTERIIECIKKYVSR
ncbi:MAG: response regulator [Candidatus Omnitrophota bacterium]